LNERPQFHLKTYRAKDVLKLLLLFVFSVDCERNRSYDLPIAGDLGPKIVVIEMTREALPRRVIDILHIDEHGYRFHQISSQTQEVGNYDEKYSHADEQHHVGHKVREQHQCKSADQRNDRPLLLAVNKISQPDRAEEQPP
jgi:hypothetical protein